MGTAACELTSGSVARLHVMHQRGIRRVRRPVDAQDHLRRKGRDALEDRWLVKAGSVLAPGTARIQPAPAADGNLL